MTHAYPTGQTWVGVPDVDLAAWRLVVDGWVAGPLTLRLRDLHALPQHAQRVAVGCTHTAEAPPTCAVWRGVRLSTVLTAVRPRARATVLNIYSADGYATSLPLAAAADALIALERDGTPLRLEQGGPARLVLSGRAGYKLPKWVRRLDVAEQPVLGQWEQRGAPADGLAVAQVGFDAGPWPRPARLGVALGLAGWATGGASRVHAVVISVDDGPWVEVPLAPSEEPVVRWAVPWTPTQPGRVVLRARALCDGAHTGEQATLLVAVHA